MTQRGARSTIVSDSFVPAQNPREYSNAPKYCQPILAPNPLSITLDIRYLSGTYQVPIRYLSATYQVRFRLSAIHQLYIRCDLDAAFIEEKDSAHRTNFGRFLEGIQVHRIRVDHDRKIVPVECKHFGRRVHAVAEPGANIVIYLYKNLVARREFFFLLFPHFS